jgi:membrane fusion protein (multidrug efflux system)
MRTNDRIKRIAIVGVFVLGSITSGCGRQQVAPPSAIPEVAIVTVQPQRVEITTELAGRISAYTVAEVRPQVGGIIQKRLFTEGSDVKAGEVLYQIDPSTYQAAYNNAKAALTKAEANIVPVRLKADRYKELVAINAVSKQDYDDVAASLKLAEAEIEASEAALETARINLDHTRVKAPISGRIGKSLVTTGALSTANQPTPLATVQELNPVYVDVTQSTANLLRLKQSLADGKLKQDGTKLATVKLLLENGMPYPLEGTLKFSDVTVDQTTGSVILRSVFPNPNHVLLPGMYVRAVIEEGVDDRAILIPQKSVTRDPGGNATALIVGVGKRVELRSLKVSRAVGDKWLVTDGLKAGDPVIVEGAQKAPPGALVKVVNLGGAEPVVDNK